jgi:tRNA (adenine22-N1)-methyltransferase
VTIAGMGGTLISEILESGFNKKKINGSEKLILQPNVGEKNVRIWLVNHNYKIVAEEILVENRKLYEIIVAENADAKVDLTDEQLTFGPFLIKEKSDIFKEKWQGELQQRNYVIASLKKSTVDQSEKIAAVEKEIVEIEEVLS